MKKKFLACSILTIKQMRELKETHSSSYHVDKQLKGIHYCGAAKDLNPLYFPHYPSLVYSCKCRFLRNFSLNKDYKAMLQAIDDLTLPLAELADESPQINRSLEI